MPVANPLNSHGQRTRYQTVVADPPWAYEGFASSVADGRNDGARAGMTQTKLPYPSMTVDEIAELPVGYAADRNAFLFLWCTNRYLPDAFDVLAAWGFRYRQTIVWDKGSSMSPFGGSVTPNRAEYLLFGKRGEPRLIGRWSGGSVVEVPKGSQTGDHSRKPEVFLDLVETVCPGPYLELFARRQRLGWDTWGNQALEHVALTH